MISGGFSSISWRYCALESTRLIVKFNPPSRRAYFTNSASATLSSNIRTRISLFTMRKSYQGRIFQGISIPPLRSDQNGVFTCVDVWMGGDFRIESPGICAEAGQRGE